MTEEALREGAAIVAVTRGREVLLVSVYDGDRAPKPGDALDLHAAELEERLAKLGKIRVKSVRFKWLGRNRATRRFNFIRAGAAYEARVSSARRRGLTIVVAWELPVSRLADAFSAKLVSGLSVPSAKAPKHDSEGR